MADTASARPSAEVDGKGDRNKDERRRRGRVELEDMK
jgi:hypothetical protein